MTSAITKNKLRLSRSVKQDSSAVPAAAQFSRVITADSAGLVAVHSSLPDYKLPDNFEHLVLAGTGDINGTGNFLANSIIGNSGNNLLKGGAGKDTLDGGAGNDTLDGGLGADLHIGGLGDDVFIVDNPSDLITEGADEGTDTVRSSAVTYTLPDNVENLVLTKNRASNGTGNALDNRLTGSRGRNLLSGGDGNDILEGGLGNDTLDGGNGNDTLDGGEGNDRLDGGIGADFFVGGLGNDTFFVDDVGDRIAEEANAGTDTVISTVSREMRPNLENLVLIGSAAIDGVGNDLRNRISGNLGPNVMTGGGGNDSLYGGNGNDTLSGCVVGANGGRREIDTLTGGAGNDLFVLGWSAGRLYDDTLPGQPGKGDYTLITDFTVGQDKLQLDGAATDYFLEANHRVSGVAGSGLFHDTNGNAKWDATDELMAIVRSADGTALTADNTIKTAAFV